MTTDNQLHADPGIDVHAHPNRSALQQTEMQRDHATTIYEKSKPGRRAFVAPGARRARARAAVDSSARTEPPKLPEIAEPEIVRHYNRLSKRNFDLDTRLLPARLVHDEAQPEAARARRRAARQRPPAPAAGARARPGRAAADVGAPAARSARSPACRTSRSSRRAGSHGELAGVLLTRAYHEDRGEHRTKVLTPDTAHGTNPATVTMGGYEVVKVGTNERGGVDLDDLRAKADDDVACLMLTNPNTLGLFEEDIEEIAKIVHGVGATLYYDGANLNAVMGRTRPGDMGFDIVHFNLHKTFTQPHGGGGPGAGPIAVSTGSSPTSPRPQVVKREDGSLRPRLRPAEVDRPPARLPGQLRRLRALLRVHPVAGRRRPAGGVRDRGPERQLPARRLKQLGVTEAPRARVRPPLHARVRALRRADEEGARPAHARPRQAPARHSFHPPTVYFPLIVDEALMVEPTETETKETLDAFAEAVAEILREGAEDPEIARNAPYQTPVRRLDEAGAAKRPVIRQPL